MTTKERILLSANSTLHFLAAFIFVYGVFIASTFFFSYLSGIESVLFKYKITFVTPDNSSLWTSISIIMIFGMPYFFVLATSLFARRLYDKARRRSNNRKLFLLWVNLQAGAFFWGALLGGMIDAGGFAYFLNWMYIPFFVQVILAVVGMGILFLQHKFALYAFCQNSSRRKYLTRENQRSYKFFIIYIPFLVGFFIFTLLQFPGDEPTDRIVVLMLLFSLFPTLKGLDAEDIKLTRHSRVFHPDWVLVIVPLIVFLLPQLL